MIDTPPPAPPIGRPWICARCYHVNGDDVLVCSYCRTERLSRRIAAFVLAVLVIVGGYAVHDRMHDIITARAAQ